MDYTFEEIEKMRSLITYKIQCGKYRPWEYEKKTGLEIRYHRYHRYEVDVISRLVEDRLRTDIMAGLKPDDYRDNYF